MNARNFFTEPKRRNVYKWFLLCLAAKSRLYELARVLVGLDHVASLIVNANHGIMSAAVKFGVVDRIRGLFIPQPAKVT